MAKGAQHASLTANKWFLSASVSGMSSEFVSSISSECGIDYLENWECKWQVLWAVDMT